MKHEDVLLTIPIVEHGPSMPDHGVRVVRVLGVDFFKKPKEASWHVVDNETISPNNLRRAEDLMRRGQFGSLMRLESFVDRVLRLAEKGLWYPSPEYDDWYPSPEYDDLLRKIDLIFHQFRLETVKQEAGGRTGQG